MTTRQERGEIIAKTKNQIHRITDTEYKVNSQSSNKQYHIISTEYGYTCSCPDHKYRVFVANTFTPLKYHVKCVK